MSKQSLLLVDGDARSLRVLEVSLRKAGFVVTPASSVADALDKLELHAPDLIISETVFEQDDGFALRSKVRSTPEWAAIPFIFLTAEAAIEHKIRGLELGVDDYLTKPIYIKEIVTRINILLSKRQRLRFEERKDGRTRFAGRVADMPVVDVIQTIEVSRKSGVIQFSGDRNRQAAIYFRDGRVIDAEAGALQGEDAVYRLLTWSEGDFEVVFRTVRRRDVITVSSQGLLMEGMRRLDEWSRLLEQLPPLTHRFEIDAEELAVRLAEVPDDNNRILRMFDGKRTLVEVIDSSDVGDLECLQVISRLYFEGLLIDLDPGRRQRPESGRVTPLVEVNVPTPIEEVASGPLFADEPIAPAMDATQPVQEAAVLSEQALVDSAATAADEPGALMGGYRPSSLRLIDEAVAAAQAIEPSLFDDAEDEDAGIPEHVDEDASGSGAPPRPTPPRERVVPPPEDADLAGRTEDSGLRMIGSLGRARAEASGEVVPEGPGRDPVVETQRELVTILPRRVTRELQVEKAPPVAAADAPTAIPRTTTPRSGSGVHRDSGPGPTAVALIIIAAVLAGVSVFLWIRRGRTPSVAPSDARLAAVLDAGADRDGPPVTAPDAGLIAMAPVDARAAVKPDAAVVVKPDAAVVVKPDAAATPEADLKARARELYRQAELANDEGAFARALELADESIATYRSARGYLVQAQARHRLGRVDDAIQSTVAAEKLAPNYATVFEVRGNILWAQRRWDDAHDAYNRFLEIEQESARADRIRRRLEETH